MINSYNGLKNGSGLNGSINPKKLNGLNVHNTNGNVFEKGTDEEYNYKNNKKPVAFSTHEAILTHKQIKEPHLNSLYQLNAGIYHPTKPLPLPPFEDMPVPIPGGFCEKSGTSVIFDEDVHLNLGNYYSKIPTKTCKIESKDFFNIYAYDSPVKTMFLHCIFVYSVLNQNFTSAACLCRLYPQRTIRD